MMNESRDGRNTGRNWPRYRNWNADQVDALDDDYLLASNESAMSRLSDPEAIRLKKLKGEIHAKAEKIEDDKLEPRKSEE